MEPSFGVAKEQGISDDEIGAVQSIVMGDFRGVEFGRCFERLVRWANSRLALFVF